MVSVVTDMKAMAPPSLAARLLLKVERTISVAAAVVVLVGERVDSACSRLSDRRGQSAQQDD
jgi:hypothetical protein